MVSSLAHYGTFRVMYAAEPQWQECIALSKNALSKVEWVHERMSFSVSVLYRLSVVKIIYESTEWMQMTSFEMPSSDMCFGKTLQTLTSACIISSSRRRSFLFINNVSNHFRFFLCVHEKPHMAGIIIKPDSFQLVSSTVAIGRPSPTVYSGM